MNKDYKLPSCAEVTGYRSSQVMLFEGMMPEHHEKVGQAMNRSPKNTDFAELNDA